MSKSRRQFLTEASLSILGATVASRAEAQAPETQEACGTETGNANARCTSGVRDRAFSGPGGFASDVCRS